MTMSIRSALHFPLGIWVACLARCTFVVPALNRGTSSSTGRLSSGQAIPSVPILGALCCTTFSTLVRTVGECGSRAPYLFADGDGDGDMDDPSLWDSHRTPRKVGFT